MRDELTAEEASIAKLATSEMQGRVADKCVQLFGGYGYMKEYKISRAYTDARIQRIYAGTSEIMKELISRSLVGRWSETLEHLLRSGFVPDKPYQYKR